MDELRGFDPTDPRAVCTLTVTLVEDIPESTDPYFLEPTGDFPIAEGATYFVPGGHLPAAEDWTLTKGSSLNLVVKPSDDPATHLIGMAQAGDLDADASGPDGVTIKGDFLVDLFAEHELTPEPGREYPCELTGQIGATATNTIAFMAKAHD